MTNRDVVDKENPLSVPSPSSSPFPSRKRHLQEAVSINAQITPQQHSHQHPNPKKKISSTTPKAPSSRSLKQKPLSVPYSPEEVLELCVLKPLGLLPLGLSLKAQTRAQRKGFDGWKSGRQSWCYLVKTAYTRAVRIGLAPLTAATTANLSVAVQNKEGINTNTPCHSTTSGSGGMIDLHRIRELHCHVAQIDEVFEAVLVLYLSL